MQASYLALSLVVLSSVIGAFGGFFFNKAAKKLEFNFHSLIRNYLLILGFFLFGLAAIIYIIALKHGDLNVLYPVSALTYIWSSFLAWRFLGEKINIYKASGIVLIILGAVLIVN